MIFDKEEALNNVMEIFQLGEKPRFSDQMKAIEKAQNYLQTLYEEVYREGFEKGIYAIKKIEEL